MINQITLNGVLYLRLHDGEWFSYVLKPGSAHLNDAPAWVAERLNKLANQGITHCNDNFWPNIAKAIIVVFIIGWLIGNCL